MCASAGETVLEHKCDMLCEALRLDSDGSSLDPVCSDTYVIFAFFGMYVLRLPILALPGLRARTADCNDPSRY